MNLLFELGSLKNCDNSYPTLGASEKLTSMSYNLFSYYYLESTYPLTFEWEISTFKCGTNCCAGKVLHGLKSVGSHLLIRTSHLLNPSSPEGMILTLRLDLDEDVKNLSGRDCDNSYPTLGESRKLVCLISGSPTTTYHQLIHRILGELWWASGSLVLGGPESERRGKSSFRTRVVTFELFRN